MNLAEFHERVCEPPLAQGEEKVRVTAVLLCFDSSGREGGEAPYNETAKRYTAT